MTAVTDNFGLVALAPVRTVVAYMLVSLLKKHLI